jgi:hypothetical protein
MSPSPDLARHVERYWAVSWNYDQPYRQLIVPYPNVHLTFRDGRATVHGVSSKHQIRVLEGRNNVFGVAFRPGYFRPFLDAPVSTITDRSIDAGEIFGTGPPRPASVETVEQFLRIHLPEPDPKAETAAAVVEKIAAEPDVTRVDALARDLDTSVRQLQRLFAD